MKKIAYILFGLQAFALFGSIVNGGLADMLAIGGVADIFTLLGYFLPTIIGIVLLNKSKKQNNKKQDQNQNLPEGWN